MASSTVAGPQPASGLAQWLASVQGLDPGAAVLAGGLFAKHGIDAAALDFLASDSGLLILSTWRGGRGGSSEGAQDAGTGDASPGSAAGVAGGLDPAREAKAGAAPKAAFSPKQRPQGRQKISTAERRNEGHYFSLPEPATSCTKPAQPPPAVVAKPPPPAVAKLPGAAPLAAAPSPEVPSPAAAEACFVGTVKSFSPDTGYGFITSEGIAQDVFLRACDLQGARPLERGQSVKFSLAYDGQGRPQAQSIVLQTAAAGPEHASTRRVFGRLKSVGPEYGFIDSPEAKRIHGRDVYFSRAHLPGGPWEVGKPVSFILTLNRRDQPQARDMAWEAVEPEPESDTEGSGTEAPAAPAMPSVSRW